MLRHTLHKPSAPNPRCLNKSWTGESRLGARTPVYALLNKDGQAA